MTTNDTVYLVTTRLHFNVCKCEIKAVIKRWRPCHVWRVRHCLMLKLNLSNCRLGLQGSIRFIMTSVCLIFDLNLMPTSQHQQSYFACCCPFTRNHSVSFSAEIVSRSTDNSSPTILIINCDLSCWKTVTGSTFSY